MMLLVPGRNNNRTAVLLILLFNLRCPDICRAFYVSPFITGNEIEMPKPNDLNLSVASRIVCASVCLQNRCAAFKYNKGECYVAGVNSVPFSSQLNFEEKELNVAFKKPYETSSTFDTPSRNHEGNDGIISLMNRLHTVVPDYQGWYQIDLTCQHTIHRISFLWSQQGVHHDHFHEMDLKCLLNKTSTPLQEGILLKYFAEGSYNGGWRVVYFDPPITCRYLSLSRASVETVKYYVIITEFRAFGDVIMPKIY